MHAKFIVQKIILAETRDRVLERAYAIRISLFARRCEIVASRPGSGRRRKHVQCKYRSVVVHIPRSVVKFHVKLKI